MTDSHGSVTGKRIILEIVREMREGLHPLLYSRVAPGLYCVYLHPEDFSRLEGLVPRIRAEAQRALTDEMRRLNEPARPPGLRWFVAAEEPAPPIDVPAQGWEIQIEPDRDDEVAPDTFIILSRLTLPALPQFEGGASTTKVFKTVVAGETRTKTEQVFQAPRPVAAEPMAAVRPGPAMSPPAAAAPPPAPSPQGPALQGPALQGQGHSQVPHLQAPLLPTVITAELVPDRSARVLAQIAVQDARGARVFAMDKPEIKIGPGGQFRLVDLQLDGPTRISRVHARIRRDEQGRFFIKDLSEWGTTVNGQRIARGVIREGDEIREIDVEAELPARARIGLADILFLDFAAPDRPETDATGTDRPATARDTTARDTAEQTTGAFTAGGPA